MHTRISSHNKGFTIIELLVAIVVIGILAGITIVSYTGIQQRSRDTERAGHIAQIQIALDKYYADNSQYPLVCAADNTPCAASLLSTALTDYIEAIPGDPSFAGTATDYQYVRGGTSGNAYGLLVAYEAKADCKTGTRLDTSWWGTGIPDCNATTATGQVTAPQITTSSLPTAYINFPYSHTIAATGTAPITFSIVSGALPAGVTLNPSTGQISGTPSVGGTFNVTVQASNTGSAVTRTLSLTVSLVSPP